MNIETKNRIIKRWSEPVLSARSTALCMWYKYELRWMYSLRMTGDHQSHDAVTCEAYDIINSIVYNVVCDILKSSPSKV